MSSLFEIALSFLPPSLLLLSGWSLKRIFFPDIEKTTTSFLVSLLLGSVAFIVPFLLLGVTVGFLQLFVYVHAIIVLLLLIYLRKQVVSELRFIRERVTNLRYHQTFLGGFAFFGYLVYSLKTAFSCLLGPIISGDALYFWLSMGKVFFNLDSIPVFDPYHFWDYSAEPLTSSLYSWGYFFVGSTVLEVFRGISFIFFLALPIISYEATRTWGGSRKAAQIALIVCCFLPVMDYMITLYSFYADAIAIVFAILSTILIRKSIQNASVSYSILAGLSVAMALLSKYHLGLLAGAIVIIEILSLINDSKWRKSIIATLTGSLVLLIVVAGNVMWSYLSSFVALVILGIFACIIAWIRSSDLTKSSFDWKLKLGIFSSFVLGVMSSLIWGIRTLLQGASMFGVPFIRLSPISPEHSTISQILGEVFQTAVTADRFTPLTIIGFVFHPLMNGFFSLVIVAVLLVASWKKMNVSLLWVLLFWYVGYLTIMGYFPSGRQLLPCAILLGPVLGISLTQLVNDEKSLWSYANLSLIVVIYAITSLFQMVTSNLAWMDLGFPSFPIVSSIGVPYTTSFGLETTPDLVLRTAVVSIAILSFLIVSLFISHKPRFRRRLDNAKVISILSLMITSTMIIPLGVHAISVTSGNVMTYDIDGSWNQGDYILADYLQGIVNEDDIILAFGDIVLSYLGYRILDMYHNGLFSIPDITISQNLTEIHNSLWSFGIRFLVLPANNSYLASSYSRLVDYVPFPEIITQSNASILITEMSRWQVYSLIQPEV